MEALDLVEDDMVRHTVDCARDAERVWVAPPTQRRGKQRELFRVLLVRGQNYLGAILLDFVADRPAVAGKPDDLSTPNGIHFFFFSYFAQKSDQSSSGRKSRKSSKRSSISSSMCFSCFAM